MKNIGHGVENFDLQDLPKSALGEVDRFIQKPKKIQ